MAKPRLRDPEEFTQAMKDRLAMRLLMRPNREDVGDVLPLTEAAWAQPADTPAAAARRVEELVQALASERLIVPVTVEVSPDDPDHKTLTPGKGPLETIEGAFGPSVVAFTSAEELLRWEPKGRPMTMKTYRVAVGALAASGTIILNPASPQRTLIPRAAVLALAGGDEWLPPWKNKELTQLLQEAAVAQCPAVVATKVLPSQSYGQNGWDGGVQVEIFADPKRFGSLDPRGCVANALRAVGDVPMLKESAQSVELVPKLVSEA